MTVYAALPSISVAIDTRSGSRRTVRWAMPNPIITAAAMNATMARAKRTNKTSGAASGGFEHRHSTLPALSGRVLTTG